MTGDEASFRDFVLARQRSLLRHAYLLTGDWSTAEDVVQSALLKCWPRWRRIAAAGDPEGYLRQVIVNTVISLRRRKWRGESPTERLPAGAAADTGRDSDALLTLLSALDELPPRQRAVVVLRYLEDLSEAQVAQALGCSVGTVKSQASKGLHKLRSQAGLTMTTAGVHYA